MTERSINKVLKYMQRNKRTSSQLTTNWPCSLPCMWPCCRLRGGLVLSPVAEAPAEPDAAARICGGARSTTCIVLPWTSTYRQNISAMSAHRFLQQLHQNETEGG